MHKFLFYICFEHYVLNIRRSKLYYTASGIVTPVGGRPVYGLREVWYLVQYLVYGTASGIITPTGVMIADAVPPDDEHILLETYRGI